jgi:predicted RecA/RadA family phage recombinase
MQNYVHRGETLTVTAPYTVVTGQGVVAGNIFGVAVFNAASGASLEIVTWGVFDLAKDASTFNPGDKVYWDNVNFVATSAPPASPSTTPGNREIGVADLIQASGVNAPGGLTGDATVRVRLNLCSIGLVTSADMDPGLLQKITVVLTAAQIEAMNGAPVNIIPAPLAARSLCPISS